MWKIRVGFKEIVILVKMEKRETYVDFYVGQNVRGGMKWRKLKKSARRKKEKYVGIDMTMIYL